MESCKIKAEPSGFESLGNEHFKDIREAFWNNLKKFGVEKIENIWESCTRPEVWKPWKPCVVWFTRRKFQKLLMQKEAEKQEVIQDMIKPLSEKMYGTNENKEGDESYFLYDIHVSVAL